MISRRTSPCRDDHLGLVPFVRVHFISAGSSQPAYALSQPAPIVPCVPDHAEMISHGTSPCRDDHLGLVLFVRVHFISASSSPPAYASSRQAPIAPRIPDHAEMISRETSLCRDDHLGLVPFIRVHFNSAGSSPPAYTSSRPAPIALRVPYHAKMISHVTSLCRDEHLGLVPFAHVRFISAGSSSPTSHPYAPRRVISAERRPSMRTAYSRSLLGAEMSGSFLLPTCQATEIIYVGCSCTEINYLG